MRRIILFLLLFSTLMALVIARFSLPEPAAPVMAEAYADNVLDLEPPGVTETAGSAMIAEMDRYFFSRTPTAKNSLTGALRGMNLILICADEWTPDPGDRQADPALHRLAQESAAISDVWRPDWYQGMDGRLFALLSGLIPTRVRDTSALRYTGEQDIYLPFSLPESFSREGYDCLARIRDDGHAAALRSLGFGDVRADGSAAPEELAAEILGALDAEEPVFFFCEWAGDGDAALELLLDGLSGAHRTDTVLCLLTADADAERAQLYLRAAGLSGAASELPCSELDVPPTLLNLFGVRYYSRFLSGRDIFAGAGSPGTADDLTPLVTLNGSAFAPWVTDAGRYEPASDTFTPDGDRIPRGKESAYIRTACTLNYRRYIYARRVMEMNYFRIVFSGRE